MKEIYERPIITSFDCLDKDGNVVHKHRREACFASLRRKLYRESGAGYTNEKVTSVKYYPWHTCSKVEGFNEALEAYLNILLSIPFVRRRMIEHTGYNTPEKNGDISEDKFFHVDATLPVDETFCILQMLRVPQEQPGGIKTFHDTLKRTGCERTAFLAALLFRNSKGAANWGGHCPTNGISLEWAVKFIEDPSIAGTLSDQWNSNVMGGGARKDYDYETFVSGVSGEDPVLINVAVYGSLREGLGNHRLLQEAIKEGHARKTRDCRRAVNAKMYSLGAFPALHPSTDTHPITFECYRVNKEALSRLDALEGYPGFYDRTQIMLDDELHWIYFHHTQPSDTVVTSGDWVRYVRGAA